MIHTMPVRIYYEDTDCGGVVYYANHFRYFERGRTHFLEDAGLNLVALIGEGTQFVVVGASIDYAAPARYGETLLIETRLTGVGAASLSFAHRVVRESDGEFIAASRVRLACLDATGRVCRLSGTQRKTLAGVVEPAIDG